MSVSTRLNHCVARGLSEAEVERSRSLHGSNVLTPPTRTSLWRLYLQKYQDPIIVILLVAAAVSLGLAVVEGNYLETIGIILAIFFATTVGFYFEQDAAKKFRILTQLEDEQPIKVRRDGKVMLIDRRDVVVGDVVIINVGDEIPADGELLTAVNLQVDESSLTGEQLTSKTTEPVQQDGAYAPNHLLRSSMVMNGHGEYRVTAVGDHTEIGNVARSSTEQTGVKTPLTLQLERLAKMISKWGSILSVLSFVLFLAHHILTHTSLWTSTDYLAMSSVVMKYFMMALTLIVMAVPEGLPMAITLALALNMRRMLKSQILVRQLNSCETMGAVNVICTDKTGTLTENRMQVKEMTLSDKITEKVHELLSYSIAVNSTAELNGTQVIGNPTEGALLLWLQQQGLSYQQLRDDCTMLSQEPFSTETKMMSTTAETPLGTMQFVKGAPEKILDLCRISAAEHQTIEQALRSQQERGFRTLAFAVNATHQQTPNAYTYLGFCAIEDPVRQDVPAAVEQCKRAGIEVKIVTGDTAATAAEVARKIGVWNGESITGEAFAALNDQEALEKARVICLMSRARPADKQRLVQLLQADGAVVAVTGDGTNDAPALHHAQVGLSLGSGTNVAKESSNMTLLDDSFASITKAVMWGRSLYKNIQRFLFFQLVVNVTALLLVLVGAFVGNEMPLTVTQILWVNLIMDTFAAMALASLPPTRAVLDEQPRPTDEFIIVPSILRRILIHGITFFALMFVFLLYCERNGSEGLNITELTRFFTTFVMIQFWNLFNAKVLGTYHSAFHRLWLSRGFVGIALLILLGQWFLVEFGGEIFRTTPLPLRDWLVIIGITSMVLWVGEIERFIQRHCLKK